MPRHSFRFPREIQDAVRAYVNEKVREISPKRRKQEPAYVTSLFEKLEGTVYKSPIAVIKFKATIVSDRGRNSAEKATGADFALTADIADSRKRVIKAIVGQAKLGSIASLYPSKKEELKEQIRKMRRELGYEHPKVMEIIDSDGIREPRILSGMKVLIDEPYRSESLADYMVSRVLPTSDGNTRLDFLVRVQNSDLPRLHTKVQLNSEAYEDTQMQLVNEMIEEFSIKPDEIFPDFIGDKDFYLAESSSQELKPYSFLRESVTQLRLDLYRDDNS